MGPAGGEPGDDPEGEDLNPRPDNRCTHNMPDTTPDNRDNPVIDADSTPPTGFISTLYFRNSVKIFSYFIIV